MIYKVGLILATVGSFLAVVPYFGDSFGIVKIAVATLGAFMLWSSTAERSSSGTVIDAPVALFFFCYSLSATFSVDSTTSSFGVYSQPFGGLLELLPAVLIFWGAHSFGRGWREGPLLCSAAIGISGGLFAMLQSSTDLGIPFGLLGGRAGATMGSPVFLAAVLSAAIPGALALACSDKPIGWIGRISVLLSFLGIALAESRGGFVAALLGVLAFRLASGRGNRCEALTIAASAAIVAFAMTGTLDRSASDAGRLQTWGIAIAAAIDKPVLGWGPDTLPLAMRALRGSGDWLQAGAHNDLLQVWATAGTISLAAYLWLCVAAVLALWRASDAERTLRPILHPSFRHHVTVAPAALGAVVALLVFAKVDPIPPTAVYLVAALAGVVLPIAKPAIHPLRRSIVLGALGGCLLLCLSLLAAEHNYSTGVVLVNRGELNAGADAIRRANEGAPWVFAYAERRCDLIFRIAAGSDRKRAREFMKRSLRVASGLVKYHPQDSTAYGLMATIESLSAPLFGSGLSRAAEKSSARMRELDPVPFLVEKVGSSGGM